VRYTNPVYQGYFADPYVWRDGADYFAVGTGPEEAAGVAGAGAATRTASIFPLLHSRDLLQWQELGRALVRPAEALGNSFWAPEVARAGNHWYLYYSVGHGDARHQLRVAVSDSPAGPYADCAALTDVAEVPFAIDPHPFRDRDGRWYLFHARDFLDTHPHGLHRAGTALVVSELETMTRLAPAGRTVLRARSDWQRFQAERAMYGQIFDWHTLEGPCVLEHDGRYYCLYSGGRWETDTYGVDYAVADHVLGPYHDQGSEAGARVLRTVAGRVIGPGHCSIVMAPDDETLLLAYHAWDPAMTARRMCLDVLEFAAEGLRCAGPTWTEAELPSAASPRRKQGGQRATSTQRDR
jgi:beta-xylosidase